MLEEHLAAGFEIGDVLTLTRLLLNEFSGTRKRTALWITVRRRRSLPENSRS